MSDIKQYLQFFRHIAATHVDIGHSDDEPGIFIFDWQRFVTAKRKRNTVIFMHPFQGAFAGNEDNARDVARVQWSVLQRMKPNLKDEPERVADDTKAIALDIIARMKWHQAEDPEQDWCQLLAFFNLEETEYRVDDIYEDDWTGFRVITPLADTLNLEMNPDKWL